MSAAVTAAGAAGVAAIAGVESGFADSDFEHATSEMAAMSKRELCIEPRGRGN
jgi:hypothetical protein